MKLDPRIKSLSDVLTIFDIDRAKEFIGQKGYFANVPYNYSDLSDRRYRYYGTLEAVFDTEGLTFRAGKTGKDFPYFLPESSLKPEEKKLRPYTLKEFEDTFPIGSPISLRLRGGDEIGNFLLIGYWQKQGKEDAYIYIGRGSYDLEELFENYEWHDDDTGSWVPFGVEVEE